MLTVRRHQRRLGLLPAMKRVLPAIVVQATASLAGRGSGSRVLQSKQVIITVSADTDADGTLAVARRSSKEWSFFDSFDG